MKKVLLIGLVAFAFSGCFGQPQVLVECKKPTEVNGKVFCEK